MTLLYNESMFRFSPFYYIQSFMNYPINITFKRNILSFRMLTIINDLQEKCYTVHKIGK
jgi:hypothetical protein